MPATSSTCPAAIGCTSTPARVLPVAAAIWRVGRLDRRRIGEAQPHRADVALVDQIGIGGLQHHRIAELRRRPRTRAERSWTVSVGTTGMP